MSERQMIRWPVAQVCLVWLPLCLLIMAIIFPEPMGPFPPGARRDASSAMSAQDGPTHAAAAAHRDLALANAAALEQMSFARQLRGPEGWAWFTGIPAHRLVAFYGNPTAPEMGPLGQESDAELMTKLGAQAKAYAALDPQHPVVPALDYVTPVVQGQPMSDGTWVARMPAASIEHYIDLANSNHALFFFDMQIGHSTIQNEVNRLWPYLQRPGVDLALDPEFDMPPGAIPDQVFGRMTAAEINWVSEQLANLVRSQHLPPKILIIHQFRESMLPDWQHIQLRPGVEIVTCVDGFGSPGEKIDDYRIFDHQQLIQYPGMKLFYTLDHPLMPPSAVLALNPAPLLVMYQ